MDLLNGLAIYRLLSTIPWGMISNGIDIIAVWDESLKSGLCDVIKIRVKRRDATRSKMK